MSLAIPFSFKNCGMAALCASTSSTEQKTSSSICFTIFSSIILLSSFFIATETYLDLRWMPASDYSARIRSSSLHCCVHGVFGTNEGQHSKLLASAASLAYRASASFVARNDLTTIWFGCMPTGMIVSREYSEGSNFFFGCRFWITARSPEPESSTNK